MTTRKTRVGLRQGLTMLDAATVGTLSETVISKGNAEGVESLNPAERVVFLIAELDAEAAMEGLTGDYRNSAGKHAAEVVTALESVGAAESASLIRRANQCFRGAPPQDRQERNADFWSLDEEARQQIEEAGEAFLDRPDDLGKKYEAFVQANRDTLAQGTFR